MSEEKKPFLIINEEYDEIQINIKHTKPYMKLQQENKKYKEAIDKAIEYINKYAWQEDIIGGIYTTTGKPAIDRYMKLEWDNCNELLDILKEVSVRKEQ